VTPPMVGNPLIQLLIDGVRQFEQAFSRLLEELRQKVPGVARQPEA